MIRAAFFDRDGVINHDTGYVHRIEGFGFLPGAIDAMRWLGQAGYALIIVTNQSGIARGIFGEADYAVLTTHMLAELARAGVDVLGVYYCPHLPDAEVPEYRQACDCRKPGPGLIRRAAAEHGIDPAASILIGDKPSDIAAGQAAGVGRCFLVGSARDADADARYPDLASCVAALLGGADPAARELGLSHTVR